MSGATPKGDDGAQEAVAVAKPVVQDEDEEEEPASEATSNTEAIAIGVASGLGVLFVGALVGMAKALHLVCCVLPAWPIPMPQGKG